MLILNHLTYIHPNKEVLFDNLQLAIKRNQKVALIGNNGAGKSTLLQIMAGILLPTKGTIHSETKPYYLPQLFQHWESHTIAGALQIEGKLAALQAILEGNATETHFQDFQDDWTLEERCRQALCDWRLEDLDLTQKVSTLSGGQKTKLFLAGISLHQPELVLLDEPSNHLDSQCRTLLYDFIENTTSTLVVVSHDRKLLNLLNSVYELGKRGITAYGGNYDFYAEQKSIENNALRKDVDAKEKALRKAKELEMETMERQQKLDARGKKKQQKEGLPTISMKTFKDNAERSTARTKEVHTEKIGAISQTLSELRKKVTEVDKMKFDFDTSTLHKGKVLVRTTQLNVGHDSFSLWKQPLDILVTSGDRIAIKGANGSGKTTLLKVILGELQPLQGTVYKADFTSVYIDQEYSLLDYAKTVYEQAHAANTDWQEHEVKIRLNRFLFPKDRWEIPCSNLSGGERMRLMLCCLTLHAQAPDLIVLDEPTNNLDIQNTQILTSAILDYQGTLLVISHDEAFLEEIMVQKTVEL